MKNRLLSHKKFLIIFEIEACIRVSARLLTVYKYKFKWYQEFTEIIYLVHNLLSMLLITYSAIESWLSSIDRNDLWFTL